MTHRVACRSQGREGAISAMWEVQGVGAHVHRENVTNQASPLGGEGDELLVEASFSPQQTPRGCPGNCLKSMQSYEQQPCAVAPPVP